MILNRRFLLRRRPQGEPVGSDFELLRKQLPVGNGQLLNRSHYASLDPALRGWMIMKTA